MMTLSMTIISFLVGAVLAQQFKVRVLLPAFAIVMVLAMGAGITSVQPGWFIVLLAAAISLQIGYFFGLAFVISWRLSGLKGRQHCLPPQLRHRTHRASALTKDNWRTLTNSIVAIGRLGDSR